MVADHAPRLVAVERPDRQHVLDTAVVVAEHRVGDVGTHVLTDEIQQRVIGPVGVPQREGGVVGETFGPADALVVLEETAVGILEEERREETAVGRRIEGLLRAGRALDRETRKLRLPELLAAAANLVERKTGRLAEIAPRSVGIDRRDGHTDGHLLLLAGSEADPEFQILAPGLTVAAEARRVVADAFAALYDAEIGDRHRELGREIDVSLGPPALHQLVAGERVVVLEAEVGPTALPPQRVVHVEQDEGVVGLGIGEAQHAAACRSSHLGLNTVVEQIDGIVVRRTPLSVVAVARAVTSVGSLVRARVEVDLTHPRHEEEVPEVGDSRAAQVVERKAEQRRTVVLVSGRGIVEVAVRIGAQLDAAERHLGSGIDVAVAVGPDQRADVVDAAQRVGRLASRCGSRGRGKGRRHPEKGGAARRMSQNQCVHLVCRVKVRDSGNRGARRP